MPRALTGCSEACSRGYEVGTQLIRSGYSVGTQWVLSGDSCWCGMYVGVLTGFSRARAHPPVLSV
jgi:hypothetical protein